MTAVFRAQAGPTTDAPGLIWDALQLAHDLFKIHCRPGTQGCFEMRGLFPCAAGRRWPDRRPSCAAKALTPRGHPSLGLGRRATSRFTRVMHDLGPVIWDANDGGEEFCAAASRAAWLHGPRGAGPEPAALHRLSRSL